jgi:hypothetical protein
LASLDLTVVQDFKVQLDCLEQPVLVVRRDKKELPVLSVWLEQPVQKDNQDLPDLPELVERLDRLDLLAALDQLELLELRD